MAQYVDRGGQTFLICTVRGCSYYDYQWRGTLAIIIHINVFIVCAIVTERYDFYI